MSIERIWHNVSEVIESINSGIQGLTREEAKRRLAQFGPNELAEKKEFRRSCFGWDNSKIPS